jgi:hypothetical protein
MSARRTRNLAPVSRRKLSRSLAVRGGSGCSSVRVGWLNGLLAATGCSVGGPRLAYLLWEPWAGGGLFQTDA